MSQETLAMPSHIGRVFGGRFLVKSELGRGAIGEVYLALDQALFNKPVVIKLLQPGASDRPWLAQKFEQEIEALCRIDHPGIVGIRDAGQTDSGERYFVMDYLEGESLGDLLPGGGLALASAATILAQLGQALAVAHENGIVHRDLKPDNLVIVRHPGDGLRCMIIDFGIAKVDDSQLSMRTKTGVAVGTLLYMSPEQLLAQEVTPLSDIYSMGVIAYESLTGEMPFFPRSPFELLANQRAGLRPNKYPHTLRPALSAELGGLIMSALSVDPGARPQNAAQFGNDLAQLLAVPAAAADKSTAPWPTVASGVPAAPARPALLQPAGGALPLDSMFYVEREVDRELLEAIDRRDSIVLVKGPRQVGKTSLLARGLRRARERASTVVLTDFQSLSSKQLESVESFFLALAEAIVDQLGLDIEPAESWKPRRSASMNFTRTLRRQVLGSLESDLVWAIDEADRLFSCDYASEVFGLFRSWHNARALSPDAPWHRLTMAIGYATEAHLFISDLNQSPFNVGTLLSLRDFNADEVADLNRRYGTPLTGEQLSHYIDLVGGQPYLVQRGLYELVGRGAGFADLTEGALADDGPFGEHLRRIAVLLSQDESLEAALHGILIGDGCIDERAFYRLRSAGVVVGPTASAATPRCELYSRYFSQRWSGPDGD